MMKPVMAWNKGMSVTDYPQLLLAGEAQSLTQRLSVLFPQAQCGPYSPDAATALADAGALLVVGQAEAHRLLQYPPHGRFVLVLWLTPGERVDSDLLQHSHVVGMLDPQLPETSVFTVIRSALALLERRGELSSAKRLETVLEIGRALASEKDLDTLLGLILTHARSLTGADGSSIYTRDPDGELYFRLWQNASTAATANAQKALVGEYSVAGYVARSGELVAVEDVYALPADAPYRFNPASDRAIHYLTRSLLTLPMKNKNGEVVGVLQLVNRKTRPDVLLRGRDDVDRYVVPFDSASRQIALALAGQAGVALENSILYADIERLFEGFIKASVQAIEARDPTTAGHSFRVADYTANLAMAVDRSADAGLRDITFSREQLREIRYASLLHDFGKVGVRENVLVKAKKLYPEQLEMLKQRFRYARLSSAWAAQRQLLERLERGEFGARDLPRQRAAMDAGIAAQQARLDHFLQVVLRANEPAILHADLTDELNELLSCTYPDGSEHAPLLQHFEFTDLALSRGSLSPEERVEIESHVTHTYEFLRLIPWTRDLAALPDIAYAHHEKLDGSGYPRGLRAPDIPIQARMMTIADIYDALTAPDRPYKQAVGSDRALDILKMEADGGKVDSQLLRIFIEAGAYRGGH
jgi:HD-GYP domain-containing protein (c-di-GMP phosphodiesterase class II)